MTGRFARPGGGSRIIEADMLTITYKTADANTGSLSLEESATAAVQTAALKSVLDLVAQNGGGSISLSAGTFTISGTGVASDGGLRIGSNTTLEGAGLGKTVIKLADGSGSVTGIIRTDSGQTLADGTSKSTENVILRDFSIDGNKAATTGNVYGFYSGMKPGSGETDNAITLERIEIRSCSGYGFDPHEGTSNLTIKDSIARDNGIDGFAIDGSIGVTLSGNAAYGNGRHGFNIVTGSQDVTLSDNVAERNGGSGLVIQTGDNEIREWTSHVTVTGGSLTGNGRAGIEMRQATDVAISDVTITGNAMQGVIIRGVRDVELSGNRIGGNNTASTSTRPEIKVDGYLQKFGDTDTVNDRWIVTSNVRIDGAAVADPKVPAGVTLYDYVVTAGNDKIVGTSARDGISAGKGNDVVLGLDGDDVLSGNAGHDRLKGGLGNDTLYGNAGNDQFVYEAGFDRIDGGTGIDTIVFRSLGAAVVVNLASTGADVKSAGVAIADLEHVDRIIGTNFADRMTGNASSNILDGGKGADQLSGAEGNDTLRGAAGNDTLSGGTGNDTFSFGSGWGSDLVEDFARGKDRILFNGVKGLDDFSDLAIADGTAGAVVSFGSAEITLAGLKASQLSAADFVFS
jgi:parallel beta-helix repeat protein